VKPNESGNAVSFAKSRLLAGAQVPLAGQIAVI
jgi:hypothetical protein